LSFVTLTEGLRAGQVYECRSPKKTKWAALAKETAFNEDSSKIIMQSLFSQTDSGLLPGDHGPTMPNVTEIVSSMKK
jgi:hypothetical protein